MSSTPSENIALEKELFDACFQGNTSLAHSILSSKQVDVNAKYNESKHGEIGEVTRNNGDTCLIFASGYAETVEMLMREFEPNVNHQNENGQTALYFAVMQGEIASVRLLCELGNADVELKVKDEGWTVLMIAAMNGNCQVAEYLLKQGANAYEVDKEGKTAVQHACGVLVEQLLAPYGATE